MKSSGGPAPKTIDEYVARAPPELRPTLERLRRSIRSAAPDAEEVISYGMAGFRHHGMLVYFGAFSDHASFFPGSVVTTRKFAAELESFAAGKGTLRFTADHPIPDRLVARIVKARVIENEKRDQARRRPKVGKPRRK
ncbi:MAG: DUF1801 domain-containing protein [Thermoplasmata archaeon]|nr:DUF1801 domain-containing protein [Thermoplasmata archaeon]